MDSLLGGGLDVGDVVVLEGEIGTSLEDVMTHLLYSGLRQGYNSIYVPVSRTSESVFSRYDDYIRTYNDKMKFFIDAITTLENEDRSSFVKNDDNIEFWKIIVNNLAYELERFATNHDELKKFREKLHNKIDNKELLIRNEIINNIRNILVNSKLIEILKNDEVLPTFEDFLKIKRLYVVDYNKGLIRRDKPLKYLKEPEKKYKELLKDDIYQSIDNITEIENLHNCLKIVRKILRDKKRDSAPIWMVWDSSSTIFHLTVRDRDSLHKTMDYFFHQACSAKENDYIIFHSYKKGMHDDKYIKHLEHVADSVVNLYVKDKLATIPFKFLRVTKKKNANILSAEIPYRINDGFVDKMWW